MQALATLAEWKNFPWRLRMMKLGREKDEVDEGREEVPSNVSKLGPSMGRQLDQTNQELPGNRPRPSCRGPSFCRRGACSHPARGPGSWWAFSQPRGIAQRFPLPTYTLLRRVRGIKRTPIDTSMGLKLARLEAIFSPSSLDFRLGIARLENQVGWGRGGPHHLLPSYSNAPGPRNAGGWHTEPTERARVQFRQDRAARNG